MKRLLLSASIALVLLLTMAAPVLANGATVTVDPGVSISGELEAGGGSGGTGQDNDPSLGGTVEVDLTTGLVTEAHCLDTNGHTSGTLCVVTD